MTEPQEQSQNLEARLSELEGLKHEITQLRIAADAINGRRYFWFHEKFYRGVLFYFFRGLITGFGTVIGASLIVALFLSFLSQIDFIPIIGEWATRLAHIIQQSVPPVN